MSLKARGAERRHLVSNVKCLMMRQCTDFQWKLLVRKPLRVLKGLNTCMRSYAGRCSATSVPSRPLPESRATKSLGVLLPQCRVICAPPLSLLPLPLIDAAHELSRFGISALTSSLAAQVAAAVLSHSQTDTQVRQEEEQEGFTRCQ